MNKRIKKLWIKALRSGKYKQAHAAMRTRDNTFCCLGVLCDLFTKEKRRRWKYDGPDYAIDGASYFLPESVMKWAGVNDEAVNLARIGQDRC